MQRLASLLVLHFVMPAELVRQQVTNPGLPQVERAAHLLTAPLQYLGRSDGSAFARSLATCAAQLTYAPCDAAPAQSQSVATWARAAATASVSPGLSPQPASAGAGLVHQTAIAKTPGSRTLMVIPPCPRGAPLGIPSPGYALPREPTIPSCGDGRPGGLAATAPAGSAECRPAGRAGTRRSSSPGRRCASRRLPRRRGAR